MSSNLVRRGANILYPLRRSILYNTKTAGILNQATRGLFVGPCLGPCRKFQLVPFSGQIPISGTFPFIWPSNSKANGLCSRNSRSFSTEVVSAPTTQPPVSLRDARAAAAKIKVEKVLHQAQHHTYPRAKAMHRRFKTSTKKLKLVAKLVRRARVDSALMQLALSPKRVAKAVRRCIYSAKFNAANNHGHL
jgi:ribosomal protein L22